MNKRLITYGRLFSLTGLHWYARLAQPLANIRVTFTHEVDPSDMANVDRILQYVSGIRTFLSPQEFFSTYTSHRAIEKSALLVTFDDGLLSSYLAAKEVLARYHIKAIFFIPTAVLDLKTEQEMRYFAAKNIYRNLHTIESLTPAQYLFMAEAQLKELAADGHAICPHTHSHVFLKDITTEEVAKDELIRPKEILEDVLHKRILAFAFPVGTEREVGQLAYSWIRRNYQFCFTALNGINSKNTNPYLLHRDCLPADAPLSYIQMVMAGTYDVYYRMKMRRLKRKVDAEATPLNRI